RGMRMWGGGGWRCEHKGAGRGTETYGGSSSTTTVPKREAAPTPLRPRSRVSVLVLNGNGISGSAGSAATGLLARGYRHAVPTDAPRLDYPRSLVLYRPGWQREAERLGRDARIPMVAPLDGRGAPEYTRVPLVRTRGPN